MPAHRWLRRHERSGGNLGLASQLLARRRGHAGSKMGSGGGGQREEIKRGRVKRGRRGNASPTGYPSRRRAAPAFPVSAAFAAVSGRWDTKAGTETDRTRSFSRVLVSLRIRCVDPARHFSLARLRLGCAYGERGAAVFALGQRHHPQEGIKRKDAVST